MFWKNESQKQAMREEAEKANTEAKVDLIATRVEQLGLDSIQREHLKLALLSTYSEGDVEKAVELIRLQQEAFSGTILPYNPNVEMLGAENRSNVTCYLDALLFAMFARLDAFECMLRNDQPNGDQSNLANLIRLWVNMLRTGKLIRIDMTERLQAALASCGWEEARLLQQQDTSEAFAFITETLQLPLLTLQVDLFHQGKRDVDDHKVVYERLLNLAVPPDPEGKGVKLEDCLEDYFNTRVDVLRDSPIEKRGSPSANVSAMSPTETIRAVSPEESQEPATPKAIQSDDTNDSNNSSNAALSDGKTVLSESADSETSNVTNATSVEEVSVISTSTEATLVAKSPASADHRAVQKSIPEDESATPLTTDGTNEAPVTNAGGSETSESASAVEQPTAAATEAVEPFPDATGSEAAPTEVAAIAATTATTETTPSVPSGDPNSETFDRDPTPMRRWTMLEPHKLTEDDRAASSSSDSRAFMNGRQRSTSIIQRIVLEHGQSSTSHSPSLLQQFKRQGSTIIKAVTIPAWQFFRLIPWHSTSNSEPQNDVEVVRQFNNRPVVGICLKRYTMNSSGQFLRQNTYIDIPDSLRLPAFMMGEDGIPRDSDEISADYKLVLQSVVCHRGVSLHSGHYISFARVDPKVLTDNRRHEVDPPPDYEDAQWLKFDDLAVDNRVSYVSDIKAALKAEMPYLLFYQIVPMMDGKVEVADEPPSYASTTNVAGTPLPSDRLDPNAVAGYFDSSTWGGSTTTGPSIRFSSEMDRPMRFSLDEESTTSSSVANATRKTADGISRRGSAAFTSSIIGTPVITPEGGRSPVIAPSDEPTTAQRLSRAAARLTGKSQARSRPPSQAGEGRMSLTMSRLGLVRSSKEPLRLPDDKSTDASLVTLPTTPSALGSTSALATVHTAPATASASSSTGNQSQELLSAPAADGVAPIASPGSPQPPQLDGQDDRGRHHHRHHSHFGKKHKEAKDADSEGVVAPQQPDGADPIAPGATGTAKGKDKERSKTGKMGVPERECSIM